MTSFNFQGIRQYHEGTVTTDYVNVIPLGDLAIDRIGEELLLKLWGSNTTGDLRGYFVDSKYNIYVCVGQYVRRVKYNKDDGSVIDKGYMGGVIGEYRLTTEGEKFYNVHYDRYPLVNGSGKVTFCESSTKPSQVYMCDGKYIYWWNTETQGGGDIRQESYTMNMLVSPGTTIYSGLEWNGRDPRASVNERSILNFNNAANVDNITWFDNRLVATQGDKNTVWLTCTDPAQFLRNLDLDPINGESVQLWPDWYSSTNSADRLNQAIGFAGQLYLLNNSTIEIWSRTGTEDSPLQPNSMSTIYHGGRSPLIMTNVMYLVCKDQVGGEFVGAIQAGGGFQKISNPEIERRLENKIYDIVPIMMREHSSICIRDTTDKGTATKYGFCYNQSGYWWTWYNQDDVEENVVLSIIDDICVTNLGNIARVKRDSRRLIGDKPIVRRIRDWFEHFEGRKIIRSVEPVMDTGVKLGDGDDDNIYCRVSTDRGRSFGPFIYRKLGSSGHNDKVIIWRNLGSGNNMMIEIGTSADYQLQLYQLNVVIA